MTDRQTDRQTDRSDQGELTGYPSIDKPWLKYYSEEEKNAPLPEGTVYQYMMRRNAERMDTAALNYFNRVMTYRELEERIAACACALSASGIGEGDFVSISLLAMPEAVILFYAVNRIGAICNFIVMNATEDEIQHQLQLTGSELLFSVDIAVEKMVRAAEGTSVKKIVSVPLTASMPDHLRAFSSLKDILVGYKRKESASGKKTIGWKKFLKAENSIVLPAIRRKAEELAVLEYTSGTTAESKAVMLSNLAINTVAFHYAHAERIFTFHPGERMLDAVPPFLTVGLVVCMHLPLAMGVELVLVPNPDPKLMPENIMKYHPNHFLGGPMHIEALMKNRKVRKADLSFLVTAAYGGDKRNDRWEEAVSQFLFSRGARHGLINGYGMTEVAGSFCTSTHQTKKKLPFVKNNIKILDLDTGKELPYGQEGEVCLSGPSQMDGYYKNPEATADAMFESDGITWIRTGDIGKVTRDGFFEVTGRLKRIFLGMGNDNVIYRIYPMKIEEVINTLSDVRQCTVVGLQNGEKGYLPIAYVSLNETADLEDTVKEKIKKICKERLNDVSQPAQIYILQELPVTRAGKIDFRKLEEMAEAER